MGKYHFGLDDVNTVSIVGWLVLITAFIHATLHPNKKISGFESFDVWGITKQPYRENSKKLIHFRNNE